MMGRAARRALGSVLSAFLLGACAAAQAAETSPPVDPAASSAASPVAAADNSAAPDPSVTELRDRVRERIRVAEHALEESKGKGEADNAAAPPAAAAQTLLTLKQLDVVYTQLESAADRAAELRAAERDAAKRLEELHLTGPTEARPYSFLLLEQLTDSLGAQRARVESLEASSAEAAEAVRAAQGAANQRHAERRRLKDLAKTAPPEGAPTPTDLQSAQIACELADATLRLRRLESDNEQESLRVERQRLSFLDEKVDVVRRDTRFSPGDLQEIQLALDKQEGDIRRELQSEELNAAYLEKQWADARKRLDAEADPTATLRAEFDARQVARQASKQSVALLGQQLEQIGPLRQAWERRRRLASADRPEAGELDQWRIDARAQLDAVDRAMRVNELRAAEMRRDLSDLEQRLAAGGIDTSVVRWLTQQRQALANAIAANTRGAVALEGMRQVHRKLARELDDRGALGGPLDWLHAAAQSARDAWRYELIHTEDQSLTVGKLCYGLLLLVAGWFLSSRLSRLVGRRLLPRLGVDTGGSAALESLAFYALATTATLTALHVVNVPLTMFTFLGGAFAIGLGFGSQNVLNNFISGLILLVERPVRVGDLIEVDGYAGVVQTIGTRSTRLLTGSNLELIVPNNRFLENNVVNWTLSDKMIRASVSVGVAYGSNTRDVARWLKRAADEHGLVLRKPEPFVWFTEFGDNSLGFELNFWITMRNLQERKRIESDLRFIIEQSFREAGITIAYPQRDLHIDMSGPLEVRLAPTADGAAIRAA